MYNRDKCIITLHNAMQSVVVIIAAPELPDWDHEPGDLGQLDWAGQHRQGRAQRPQGAGQVQPLQHWEHRGDAVMDLASCDLDNSYWMSAVSIKRQVKRFSRPRNTMSTLNINIYMNLWYEFNSSIFSWENQERNDVTRPIPPALILLHAECCVIHSGITFLTVHRLFYLLYHVVIL